jgi:hypothetical protein
MLEKSHSKVQHEQVTVCAEIGIECTNFNPAKRPDTEHIISRLDEAENLDKYVETGKITSHEVRSLPPNSPKKLNFESSCASPFELLLLLASRCFFHTQYFVCLCG